MVRRRLHTVCLDTSGQASHHAWDTVLSVTDHALFCVKSLDLQVYQRTRHQIPTPAILSHASTYQTRMARGRSGSSAMSIKPIEAFKVAAWYLFLFGAIALVVCAVCFKFLHGRRASEHFSSDTYKMVYVYSTSCGYCKQFDPIWTKFENQVLAASLPGVTTEKSVDAGKYKVDAFPAVLLMHNDTQKAAFDGERTPEELWTFLRKNMV